MTIGQLLYSSVYLPSTVMPSVSVDAKLTGSGDAIMNGRTPGDRRIALGADVKLNNNSDHAVTLLGARYLVRVHRLVPQSGAPSGATRARPYIKEQRSRIVEQGGAGSKPESTTTTASRSRKATRRFGSPSNRDQTRTRFRKNDPAPASGTAQESSTEPRSSRPR